VLKTQTVLKESKESSPSAMNSVALTFEPRIILTQTRNRMEKKIYITPRGARQLREELAYLWRDKRPLVTEQVRAAAALGDRSENAEYQYGKRQLREIDRRIRYLQKRLDILSVVDRIPSDRNRVFFGAFVTLCTENDEELSIRIVGEDEIDLDNQWISVNTPLARAIIGKSLSDEVEIQRPAGKITAEIVSIDYEEPNEDEG
jgi:transcription elongation factor GreB